MTFFVSRTLLLAAAGMLIVSCASRTPTAQWAHPRMSDQEQAADRSDCRLRADFQVEREVARDSPFMAEQRIEVQRMFDRDDAYRRRVELYDNCLRDKGYAPIVPEK